MGKVVLVMVMVVVVPTQPVFGVKLTLGQPPEPQPPAVTDTGIMTEASSDNKAAYINSFILLIFRLYDFLGDLSNFNRSSPASFFFFKRRRSLEIFKGRSPWNLLSGT
jgi:hypothetical protein